MFYIHSFLCVSDKIIKIITSINFFSGLRIQRVTTVKIGQEWADIKEKLSTFNLGFAKARMDRLLLNQ